MLPASDRESCHAAIAAEAPGLQGRLAEAGQQRDLAVGDRGRLQDAVDRMVAEKARAEEAHQAELGRLAEERGKAAEELADAGRRVAQLEKDLEAQARASAVREHGMLSEAQHLDEAFAREYYLFLWSGWPSRQVVFFWLICFLPLPGVFPKTQEAADAAVYTHRAEQRELGPKIDAYAAWSFSELVLAGEARLRAMEVQMHRLFEAGMGMASGL